MSRKRSWSARAEVPLLLPVAKQRLDDIAAIFAEEEVKEFLIVMDLKRLSRDYGQFEKWRHPSTGLNLLQFAVLHRRSEWRFIELKGKLANHPLHMACWLGDLDCLKALTKVDFQVVFEAADAKCDLAILMKTVSVITSAISAPLQSEPVEGQPLDLAIRSGSVSCLTSLLGDTLPVLQPNCLLPKKVEGRELTLHVACCLDCPQLVAMILAARPRDVHSRDGEGLTPLHFAVQRGQTDTIRLLLEHKADVNAWTPTHSTCLHFLFRYGEPRTLAANTKLLVEYGAMLNLTESVTDWVWVEESPHGNQPVLGDRTLTPLHVLVGRIMWSPRCRRRRLMQKQPTRKLIRYTQSDMEGSAVYTEDTEEGCMQEVVSCLRLLLEARADPNATSNGKNMLQDVMCNSWCDLSTEYPELLFTVLSTLLEFGATVAPQTDFGSLSRFLGLHVCAMESSALQASFIRLFCENGTDPDDMARHFVSPLHRDSHLWKWSLPFWTCLANRMSVRALSTTLPVIHHNQFTSQVSPEDLKTDLNQVTSSLYGSPVRSLRHSCKVAVWKALGHQGGRVASLSVPDKVKAYLKSDDL